jgi:hypothetical protein
MKRQYLMFLLVAITAILITNFWEVGMTGVIGFFLAYVTKGSRNKLKAQGELSARKTPKSAI